MKHTFKKYVAGFSILLVAVSFSQLTAPRQARAQESVADFITEVFDGLTSASSAVSSESNAAEEIATYSLDAIAVAAAKQLMMQITNSVIQWINTGFKGSPAFVQNPGKYFESIGDQVAGDFLADNSDLAANLCSPFSVDVRVALALQISGGNGSGGNGGGNGSQYSCSLSSMIANGTNAIKGASINGFTAGDFRQGGWPAFLALTTVPANSPNGAFLQAQAALSVKIANQQSIKQTQLAQGNGFLSWTTCTPDPDWPLDADDPYSDGSGQDCEVQTPGSSISNALNKSLNVPVENLELANDLNAVINAAFSELVTTALNQGLTSLSQPGPSGKTYLNSIAAENAASVKTLEKNVLANIKPAITAQTSVTSNDNKALQTGLLASNTLNDVLACDNAILGNTSSSTNPAAVAFAQNQIGQVATIISTTADAVSQLRDTYGIASTTLQTFLGLKASLATVTDTSELTGPGSVSDQLRNLTSGGNLPNATDVQQSKNYLSDTQKQFAPVQIEADSLLEACTGETSGITTSATLSQ